MTTEYHTEQEFLKQIVDNQVKAAHELIAAANLFQSNATVKFLEVHIAPMGRPVSIAVSSITMIEEGMTGNAIVTMGASDVTTSETYAEVKALLV